MTIKDPVSTGPPSKSDGFDPRSLVAQLGHPDSRVRRKGYLETEALDADGLLELSTFVASTTPGGLFAFVAATTGLFSLIAMVGVALWPLQPVLSFCTIIAGGWLVIVHRTVTERRAADRRRGIHRTLARVISRRADPRLIDPCAKIALAYDDAETGEYVVEALTNLLPLVEMQHREIVRNQERLLLELLLRPLEDVMLTTAIVVALGRFGSKRALPGVRALARAPATGEFLADALLACERAEHETRLRSHLHEEFVRNGRLRSTGSSILPDIFSYRHAPAPEAKYDVAPRTQQELEGQLRFVASAADRCLAAMEERFALEEQAGNLLHPSMAPASNSHELVRAAGSQETDGSELLRTEF